MRIVAIVQQRLGSTRLPQKALADLAGKPLTWHVLDRLSRCRTLQMVVLAPPSCEPVGLLASVARDANVPCIVAGASMSNLVRRHSVIARALGADAVVRVPGDNPCVDPAEVDRIVDAWQTSSAGGVLWSNIDSFAFSGYPSGVGAEVYRASELYELDRSLPGGEMPEREHPHKWFRDRGLVKTIAAPAAICRPSLRLDVDTAEDLAFVRSIFDGLYHRKPEFSTADVIEFLDARPKAA